MVIEQKYTPTQKVNIGVGKDNINDFARKYNLELENVYNIFNKYAARQISFTADSTYWTAIDGGYKLVIPAEGNAILFAVYKNDGTDTYSQVLTGVKQTKQPLRLKQ